ncbi:MAG: TetR/AcrR family transcriptional regulator, partial [Stackebrandtia sp.]
MCADIYALLWEDDTSPARSRPTGLSRERIVTEAITMADADGLAKLSMPRLADRLGSGVMSLYRHVPGKRELLALMYDTALTDVPALPSDQDWRPRLHTWAYAVHVFFRCHPWALPLATVNHPMGPKEFAWMDCALGVLERTPLSAAERLT